MRNFLPVISLLLMGSLQAQSYRGVDNTPDYSAPTYKMPEKKWFVTRYTGVSTGMRFFNGGTANYLSFPVVWQLNRRLNNNLYAFAGISAAPTYINFNRAFSGFNAKGLNNFGQYNHLGLYSRAELGLMYVNDQRTFSISGSVGVHNSVNPYLPFQHIQNMQRTPVVRTNH